MVGKYGVTFMYAIQQVVSTNDDYILIKKCFEATMLNCVKANVRKIYRAVIRGNKSEQKSDNLMLFHGTTRANVVGILEEGFKPSTEGKHGPGVYLTECSSAAVTFSSKKVSGLTDYNVNDSMFLSL